MSGRAFEKADGPKERQAGKLKLLTIKEAAAYARVSVSTIRRWLRGGALKSYQAGKQKSIDENELIVFLSDG